MPTTKPYNAGFKRKAKLLREARGKCEMCQREPISWPGSKRKAMESEFYMRTLTVHHINGNSLDDRDANLVVLCASCHLRVETFNRQLLRETLRYPYPRAHMQRMLENSERQLFGEMVEVKPKAGGGCERSNRSTG